IDPSGVVEQSVLRILVASPQVRTVEQAREIVHARSLADVLRVDERDESSEIVNKDVVDVEIAMNEVVRSELQVSARRDETADLVCELLAKRCRFFYTFEPVSLGIKQHAANERRSVALASRS